MGAVCDVVSGRAHCALGKSYPKAVGNQISVAILSRVQIKVICIPSAARQG